MRGRWWLSLWLVFLGCPKSEVLAPGGCRIDDDCSFDEICVSETCERVAFDLDAGLVPEDAAPRDSGAQDAGTPDSSALDAAVDSGFDATASDAATPDQGFFDAGFPDSGAPDAGFMDVGFPDTGAVDAGFPDAGFPDTGVVDAGFPDVGFPDTGVADVGFPDAGFPDAGFPDTGVVDAGPAARGVYQYRRVLVSGLASNRNLTRVLISPDDSTVVVSGRYSDLFVLDRATETLRGAQSLPSPGSGRLARIDALAPLPGSANEILVASTVIEGNNIVEGRLYRLDLSGTLAPTAFGGALSGISAKAITHDPVSGVLYLVGYRAIGGGYWVTVHSLNPLTGAATLLGQEFTSAGCQDGAVVEDGLGGRGVAYVCGINGGDVGIRDSTGAFAGGPNTGNTARIAARPQLDYAVAVAWSSGRLARFQAGQWTLGFSAPSVGNSAWNVAFSDDGARALVTGQSNGTVAQLREYRHGFYSSAEITDVSISNFGSAPFLGSNGVLLEDAAWRPGADCGYVVGGCDTTVCTRGYLIGFAVANGRPCP